MASTGKEDQDQEHPVETPKVKGSPRIEVEGMTDKPESKIFKEIRDFVRPEFEKVNEQFTSVNKRFDSVDKLLGSLGQEVGGLKQDVDELKTDMKTQTGKIDALQEDMKLIKERILKK